MFTFSSPDHDSSQVSLYRVHGASYLEGLHIHNHIKRKFEVLNEGLFTNPRKKLVICFKNTLRQTLTSGVTTLFLETRGLRS